MATSNQISQQELIRLANSDLGLSESAKQELVEKLHDDEFYDKLMHGTVGAGTGYIVSKFLNLSKRSQMLLSVAGFGVGTYLLDSAKKHDKFLKYNKQLKIYEIKD